MQTPDNNPHKLIAALADIVKTCIHHHQLQADSQSAHEELVDLDRTLTRIIQIAQSA